MSEEKLEKCPICGEEMFINEDGQLQCPNLVYHEMTPELKKFFKGQWLGLPNITIDMRWQGKPISENPPVCNACGTKVSGKEVERAVGTHHVSYDAYNVQRAGEYNAKLADLYEAIKKRKINLEEALKRREELRGFFNKPKQERPVNKITGSIVALKCSNCEKKIGGIQVELTANPEDEPEPPTTEEWIALKLSPQQEREAKEHFNIEGSLEEWLEDKELQTFIGKLEALKNDISHIPYTRSIDHILTDLNARIYAVLEKLRSEAASRKDQLYNFLVMLPETMAARVKWEREEKEREERFLKAPNPAAKPILKEGFPLRGKVTTLTINGFSPIIKEGKIFGRAIHPMLTVHPDQFPALRKYVAEHLQKALVHSSFPIPIKVDHSSTLDFTKNRINKMVWNPKELAVDYEGIVEELVAKDIANGVYKNGVSVEIEFLPDIGGIKRVNGFMPYGFRYSALSLLKEMAPGDPVTNIKIWKDVTKLN